MYMIYVVKLRKRRKKESIKENIAMVIIAFFSSLSDEFATTKQSGKLQEPNPHMSRKLSAIGALGWEKDLVKNK